MTLHIGCLKNAATRAMGAEKRAELLKALARGERVSINFDEMTKVTPSFVDELIGKLVSEIGEDQFQVKIALAGVTPSISSLIAAVVAGRAKQFQNARVPAS